MNAILEQHTANIILFLTKEYNISRKERCLSAIKLPWTGKIVEEQCKGLKYNGGLYTQCTNINKEYCSICQKNKYGTVYDRLKCPIGEYRDVRGRKEINFMSYLKKNHICLKDVERECERVLGQKLPEEYMIVKRRGRPKKKKQIVEMKDVLVNSLLDAQKEEEIIDCQEFSWENKIYWKDIEGNLYNSNTKEHIGIYDIDHNIVTLYC